MTKGVELMRNNSRKPSPLAHCDSPIRAALVEGEYYSLVFGRRRN